MTTRSERTPDSLSTSPTVALPSLGDLMTSAEVAETIRVPAATLRYWRHIGIGPEELQDGSASRPLPA